jgi:Tfp pilus assembly protein PilO
MKPATKRFISSGIALILVVAAFVVYFDFVRPAYSEIGVKQGEMASSENLLKNQKSAIDQVEGLIQSYGSRTDLQGVVSEALPPGPDVATALAQINGIAENNRLSPQSFSVSLVSTSGSSGQSASKSTSKSSATFIKPIGRMNFQVKLIGTYEDLKLFLRSIETNTRIMDVQSISVQQVGKPGQNLFSYELVVMTYYQNP